MAQRFEDLRVWRSALDLSQQIYRVTREGGFARNFGLKDQVRRAAVSVMSNIAEGFERDGDCEFRQFLFVAKGSCGEVRSQLHLAQGLGYVDEAVFRDLYGKAMNVTRMLAALIKHLDASPHRGVKFKA